MKNFLWDEGVDLRTSHLNAVEHLWDELHRHESGKDLSQWTARYGFKPFRRNKKKHLSTGSTSLSRASAGDTLPASELLEVTPDIDLADNSELPQTLISLNVWLVLSVVKFLNSFSNLLMFNHYCNEVDYPRHRSNLMKKIKLQVFSCAFNVFFHQNSIPVSPEEVI